MRFTRPHKTQETKIKLLAFCGLALLLGSKLATKTATGLHTFFLGCSECCAKEGLKGCGLQARVSFRSTPSLVTQSNPVPAGGCGPAPETPFRVRVACAGTKAEAATVEGCKKELPLSLSRKRKARPEMDHLSAAPFSQGETRAVQDLLFWATG